MRAVVRYRVMMVDGDLSQYHRKIHVTGFIRRMVDALRGLYVVAGLREKDIRNKRLRIAIVKRKPRRLHLHHNAMSRCEHVIHGGQSKGVGEWLSWRDRLRVFETFSIAAAEAVHRNAKLVST